MMLKRCIETWESGKYIIIALPLLYPVKYLVEIALDSKVQWLYTYRNE